jgi:hypothetical protein
MFAYKCICAGAGIVNAFTGKRASRGQDAVMVQRGEERMIMTRKQQLVTAFLAVLIVASVMSMPRTLDAQREPPKNRATGTVAAAPTATVEINTEQVKDLTYN